MLIHGFGVSSFQYRETLKSLSLSNKVYALDLVGFGGSGASDTRWVGVLTCFNLLKSVFVCSRLRRSARYRILHGVLARSGVRATRKTGLLDSFQSAKERVCVFCESLHTSCFKWKCPRAYFCFDRADY